MIKIFFFFFSDLLKVEFTDPWQFVSSRELSSVADPVVDYFENKKKINFNRIPMNKIGLFKNDIPDIVEEKRIKTALTKFRKSLKSIARIELKNAKDFVEIVEFED